MVNKKELLVNMLNDAVMAYEVEVSGPINVYRQRQINQIRGLCSTAQYDAVIVSFVNRLIIEMNAQRQVIFLFGRAPGRLSAILTQCLIDYKEAIIKLEEEHERRSQDVLHIAQEIIEHIKKKTDNQQQELKHNALPSIRCIEDQSRLLLANT